MESSKTEDARPFKKLCSWTEGSTGAALFWGGGEGESRLEVVCPSSRKGGK